MGAGLAEKLKLKIKALSGSDDGVAAGLGPGVGIGGSLGVDWGYKTTIKCWNTPCDNE